MKRGFTVAMLLVLTVPVALSANWPQWRGPQGTGTSNERNLPVTWSATENVAWRADLGGVGVSSPIVVGNIVIVTSQAGKSPSRQGPRLAQGAGPEGLGERPMGTARGAAEIPDQPMFLVEAYDRQGGKRLWQYHTEALGPIPTSHDKANMALSSPVSDGSMIYAWFSNGQLVALNMKGTLVWQRHLGKDLGTFDIEWGHSSSPTLFEDTLILLCDNNNASNLLAVDKKTGTERWRVNRGPKRQSYSTPFVVPGPSGPELVVNSSQRVDVYNPRNGDLLWHVGNPHQFPIPSPTYHDGVLYMSRGYRSGPYMAVRTGGKGDVNGSHVVWQAPTGAPYISSLVYDSGLVYMTTDIGGITAVDAATGERVWQQRVGTVFSASPVVGDGKVYFTSETGAIIVVKSGAREPNILARNEMGERFIASPAISNGRLFFRSDDRLFSVGP
jgi:outer membrane protein assembly factor BamB